MSTVGSLCSGIGGLDLAVESFGHRLIWQAESDPFCRRVLKARWPTTRLLEDVRAAAGAQAPDILVAGFPCQPSSQVGARKGAEDARWLWPEIANLVGRLEPITVVLENVRGLLRVGGVNVVSDLTRLGYDVRWGVVAASTVSAPHRRQRVFLLANAQSVIRQQKQPQWVGGLASGGPSVADAVRERLQERDQSVATAGNHQPADPPGSAMADAAGVPSRATVPHGRGEVGRGPETSSPSPGVLNPAWLEPLMGLPEGWTDPTIPNADLPAWPGWPARPGQPQHDWEAPRLIPPRRLPDRAKRVRALGNMCVPQQAAYALNII